MLIEDTSRLRWLTFPAPEDLRWSLRNVYLQSEHCVRLFTHVRQPFTTYVIDLTQREASLRDNYSKKLRENVRRATREGITVERDQDPTAVVELFQTTIQEHDLNVLTVADFSRKENLLITRAVHPQLGVLAAHAYLLDRVSCRIKLLYNASAFRQYPEDRDARYLCGRANSLLFHRDLLYFQTADFTTFDFGGYGGQAPGADYFKDRFGGMVVQQYNYYPAWYYGWRKLRTFYKLFLRG